MLPTMSNNHSNMSVPTKTKIKVVCWLNYMPGGVMEAYVSNAMESSRRVGDIQERGHWLNIGLEKSEGGVKSVIKA